MNYLKSVLETLKAQMFLVICAAVALVALLALYWPFGAWADKTRAEMKAEWEKSSAIENFGKQNISFPGLVYVDGNNHESAAPPGVVIPQLSDLKKQAMKKMETQALAINREAADQNRQNRLSARGLPLFNGKPMDGYLPGRKNHVNYHLFRDETYAGVYHEWLVTLTGQSSPDAGEPPSLQAILDDFRAQENSRIAKIPVELRGVKGFDPKPEDTAAHVRRAVARKAAATYMYVSAKHPGGSFQRRKFAGERNEPKASEVFEAFVDTWCQGDVVAAIARVNAEARQKNPGYRGVSNSPIKNLLLISVGSQAESIFRTQTGGGSGGALFRAAPSRGKAGTAAIDLTESLTGRRGGADYDVSLMTVSIVAETDAVNRFIEALYKRNNGYTVINRRDTAVDPYEALSKGFVYGSGQCVQVDLLLEVLFFRGWTEKVMPENYANAAGG